MSTDQGGIVGIPFLYLSKYKTWNLIGRYHDLLRSMIYDKRWVFILLSHNIAEILLKLALNTNQSINQFVDIDRIVDIHCLNFLFITNH
jgi:hypothetical protein